MNSRPEWLRKPLRLGPEVLKIRQEIGRLGLATVCESARCPNLGECWSAGIATFLILGERCTRACAFCAVKTGKPTWFDRDEPKRVAEAVIGMGLDYVVLTSVNRDDLEDGGASAFAETLRQLREQKPNIGVEFLTPDFRNTQANAVHVFNDALVGLPEGARRDLVWGHNVETVPRFYREARKGAQYQRSLELLALAAQQPGVEAKSALMLGLGETREEVLQVLRDLSAVGVARISLGQYLRPSLDNLPVARYVHPDEFADYEAAARDLGFAWVKAGPLVRSSYYAEEIQQGTQHG